MINPVQILCLDIDGTLLDTKHCIPFKNKEAVQLAAQKGVIICLMSARPPGAIVPIANELQISGPIVCYNGGFILSENTCIYDARIPAKVGIQILQETVRCAVHLSIYREWEWFIEKSDAWSTQESMITGLVPTEISLKKACEQGAHKLLCMGDTERINLIFQELSKQNLPVQLVRSKDTYLEILPYSADKAEAMQTVCRVLNIPLENTMAIGDHDNDCGMLRMAAYSAAMGNGSSAAKQAAKFLTDDNDHAGVSRAIHTWILTGEVI